jgi:hypothetical protein
MVMITMMIMITKMMITMIIMITKMIITLNPKP